MGTAHKGVVFVIDDEEGWRESTEELFEDEGYLVLSARNGVEALSRMRGISGPAVALVDLAMPEMNGWELIASMQADASLSRIPVLVLSAQAHPPVEGATRFMRKPVQPKELLSAVEGAMTAGTR